MDIDSLRNDYTRLSNRVDTLELQQLKTDYAALGVRVSALERPPERKLLGGWRIVSEYALGSFAIDFATNRMWMAGNAGGVSIGEFRLPAMGAGTNIANWPQVAPSRTIGQFWPQISANRVRPYGICFWQNKFWIAPRVFYAADNAEAYGSLSIYSERGDAINLPALERQRYAGFVKRGPGLEPLIGSGGYSSGQNSNYGPTLATMAGVKLLPDRPFANIAWQNREIRDSNYSVPAGDSYLGIAPRGNEGRWTVERVYGGGLVLPEGICFWPTMMQGSITYETLVNRPTPNKTAKYVYDKNTYALKSYAYEPIQEVCGQELDSSGNVYLSLSYRWGNPQVHPTISVYGSAA